MRTAFYFSVYVYVCALYRAKHPVKVLVWAGISVRGPTGIFIFEGTMDADMYVEIVRETLLPFLHDEVYPTGHCFIKIMIRSIE